MEKQIIEARRYAVLARAKEAEENLAEGKVVNGTVEEMMEYIEND